MMFAHHRTNTGTSSTGKKEQEGEEEDERLSTPTFWRWQMQGTKCGIRSWQRYALSLLEYRYRVIMCEKVFFLFILLDSALLMPLHLEVEWNDIFSLKYALVAFVIVGSFYIVSFLVVYLFFLYHFAFGSRQRKKRYLYMTHIPDFSKGKTINQKSINSVAYINYISVVE